MGVCSHAQCEINAALSLKFQGTPIQIGSVAFVRDTHGLYPGRFHRTESGPVRKKILD